MTRSSASESIVSAPWWINLAAHPGRMLAWTLLLIGGIVMMTPLVYMVATSLKYSSEVYDLNIIPREPTFDNYLFIFKNTPFGILAPEFVRDE